MGRRSTSSTKSGKFMNPTDQASKYLRQLKTSFHLCRQISFGENCLNSNKVFPFLCLRYRKGGQEKGIEKGTF